MPYDFFGNLLPRSGAPVNFLTGGAGSLPVVGGILADHLTGGGSGHPLSGGLGDDTYKILSLYDSVFEAAGQGIDTVVVAGTKGADAIKWFYLPQNVENLVLSGQITGFGNTRANLIEGGAGSQVVVGGEGNDVLAGGAASDVFHFKLGSDYDVVLDFNSGEGDLIRLEGYDFQRFSDVQAALTQHGADTILQLSPTDAIRFAGKQVGSFAAKDFALPIDVSALTLTFADEFDTLNLFTPGGWDPYFPFGPAGGPDSEITHTHGNELQIYVDETYAGLGDSRLNLNPFSIDDGVLSITLQKTPQDLKDELWNYGYTSGMLSSSRTFYQQYGYFEMKAKLPVAPGMWSAFWLLPKDQSPVLELDVFENIGDNRTYATEHHQTADGAKVVTNIGHVVDDISQFHTYGFLWTSKELVWYVDGVMVYSQATSPDLDRPMYIVANLAIGGAWSGPPDPGFTTATMEIDYIRAYDVHPDATRLNVNNGVAPPAYDTYTGDTGNNILGGSSGADLIQGLDGADTLDGGLGNDTLDGGLGGDTARYLYAHGGVRVSLAESGPQDTGGAGVDTLISIENLIGSNSADELTGSDVADQIDGKGGADIIEGGLGNDNLRGGAGTDVASYAHAASAVSVSLAAIVSQNTLGAGSDKLAEFEGLLGSAYNDTLTGSSGDNTLEGGSGNDSLDGGEGADTASYKGAGSGVAVDLNLLGPQNTGGAGTDLLTGFENLLGSAHDDVLRGNGLANKIFGGRGNDLIHGDDGDDTLAGGGGSDQLFGGGGSDTATFTGARIDYAVSVTVAGTTLTDVRAGMPDGVILLKDVELVSFSDGVFATSSLGPPGATIHGTALADTISAKVAPVGQPKATILSDTLYGYGGSDKLDGAAGSDLMFGGAGDDFYTVDTLTDKVIEIAGEGTDKVTSTATFFLADNVENLTLAGSAAINGSGNAAKNKLVGNLASNSLFGLGGDDALDGGAGADLLYGGTGNDVYTVDNVGDQVFEVAGEGIDTVNSTVSYVLSADVENLTIKGSAAVNGEGNALANKLTGNGSANELRGGGGADNLMGGIGDDLLVGGTGKDKLTGGAGADTFLFGPAILADSDLINDFASGVDHLAFRASDYGLPAGALAASKLVFGAAAIHNYGEFIYDAADKELLWDADGVGGAAAVQVATFATGITLTAVDFLILA